MKFKPCINRNACTEDGTHCRACGRAHTEIEKIRNISSDLTSFILEMGYENADEFMDYLKRKVEKKVKHAKA